MREIENLFSRSEAFFSEPNFVKRLVVRSPKGKYSKTCAGKIWSSAAVATHCRRKGREFDQRENEVLFTGRVAWQRFTAWRRQGFENRQLGLSTNVDRSTNV